LFPAEKRSNIIDTLEEVMIDQPEYWHEYYRGEEASQRLARKFSRSDRIRYYWGNPRVQFALGRLLQNLKGKKLPLTLVSQFLPVQCERIRSGQINNSSEAVILNKVNFVLDEYALACG
jgi:D-tagatose-1,6-bisphosphate aldolase subunit GatZ/KbaZ